MLRRTVRSSSVFLVLLFPIALLHAGSQPSVTNPDTARANQYVIDGYRCLSVNDLNSAITNFENALRINPELRDRCMKQLADCHDRLGMSYEDASGGENGTNAVSAENHYLLAIKNDDLNNKYYLHLASFYNRTGDRFNALKIAEKASELGADRLTVSLITQQSITSNQQKYRSGACRHCGKNIGFYDAYCPYCGRRNSEQPERIQSEKKFELMAYYSLLGGSKAPSQAKLTSNGEDISVETGGQYSIGLRASYGFNDIVRIFFQAGFAAGAFDIPINNGNGSFQRFPFEAGIIFQKKIDMPGGSSLSLYGGPAAMLTINPVYHSSFPWGNTDLAYQTSFGIAAHLGIGFNPDQQGIFVYFAELTGYRTLYRLKNGSWSGGPLVPGNANPVWLELDAYGIGVSFGAGIRI